MNYIVRRRNALRNHPNLSLAVFVDQPSTTFEFQLSSKPRKVTFNAGDAVIAKVKRR